MYIITLCNSLVEKAIMENPEDLEKQLLPAGSAEEGQLDSSCSGEMHRKGSCAVVSLETPLNTLICALLHHPPQPMPTQWLCPEQTAWPSLALRYLPQTDVGRKEKEHPLTEGPGTFPLLLNTQQFLQLRLSFPESESGFN
jgi:hypothetical protein